MQSTHASDISGFGTEATDPDDESRPVTKQEFTKFSHLVENTFQRMYADIVGLITQEVTEQYRQRRCVEIQAELAEILRFDLKNYHLEEEPTIPTRDDDISPFSVASPKLRSLADKLGTIEKELSMLLPSEEETNDEQESTED